MKREQREAARRWVELTWICKPRSRADRRRKRWPRLRVINGEFVVMAERATPA